jgi:hypothetical protein
MANACFCPSCGVKTEGNTIRETNHFIINCDCGFTGMLYIQHNQTKTDAEVEDMFQATELTYSQRGHSSPKRKK